MENEIESTTNSETTETSESSDSVVVTSNEQVQQTSESTEQKTQNDESTQEASGATDENESNEEETEENEEQPKPEKKAPSKKPGVQKRIDKITREKRLAQQEAEYWKDRFLNGSKPPVNNQSSEAIQNTQVKGEPNPDNFEHHGDYLKALAKWEVDQRLSQKDAEDKKVQVQRSQKELADQYVKSVEVFKKTQKDFDEVLDGVADVSLSPVVESIILRSKNNAELAYELAKDPVEFERINGLDALEAAEAIGLVKARIAARTQTKPEIKTTTNAAKPITPVGGKTAIAVTKSIYDPNLTQAEYEKLRDQMDKKRHGARL
jgi:hypothetical protein